jgi:hypothetical protein
MDPRWAHDLVPGVGEEHPLAICVELSPEGRARWIQKKEVCLDRGLVGKAARLA